MPNTVSQRLRNEWLQLPEVEVQFFDNEDAAEICYRFKMPNGLQGTGVFQAAAKYIVLLQGPDARCKFAADKFARLINKHATAIRSVIGEPLTESFARKNRLKPAESPDSDAMNSQEPWRFEYDWKPNEDIWPAVVAWAAEQAATRVNGLSEATQAPETSGRKVWPCVLTLVCDVLETVEMCLKPLAPASCDVANSGGQKVIEVSDDRAKAFRDGNQWCTAGYAKVRYNITPQQLTRASTQTNGLRVSKKPEKFITVARKKAQVGEGKRGEVWVYHAGELRLLADALNPEE